MSTQYAGNIDRFLAEQTDYFTDVRRNFHGSKVDHLSMSSLRTTGQDIYLDIDMLRSEKQKAIDSYQKGGKYSQEFVQKKVAEIEAEYKPQFAELIEKFNNEVKRTIANKKARLDNMVSAPPTPEQLNLLTALQMRGKNISIGEIQRIAVNLADNYQAFISLKNIADNLGMRLMVPDQFDYDAIQKSISWAEKYLTDRVHDLSRPWKQMNPCGRLFFGTGWNDGMYEQNAIAILDGAKQMETVIVKPRVLTDTEKATLDRLFENVESDELESKVRELAAESDSLKNLLALHPTYGSMLDTDDTK